jgi:hypothetical protein
MEAELQDAPHLNHAEIANPQFFAPVVEYFEHQFSGMGSRAKQASLSRSATACSA